MVQIPAVQKRMAMEFTSWLAEAYQIQLQSDKIKFGILSGLQWNDVLLLNNQQDTLVYVEELKIETANLSFNHFKKFAHSPTLVRQDLRKLKYIG